MFYDMLCPLSSKISSKSILMYGGEEREMKAAARQQEEFDCV